MKSEEKKIQMNVDFFFQHTFQFEINKHQDDE